MQNIQIIDVWFDSPSSICDADNKRDGDLKQRN